MKINLCYCVIILVVFFSCTNGKAVKDEHQTTATPAFKVIGYYFHTSKGPAARELDLSGLTHINYSFVLPSRDGNGLGPFKHEENLKHLVEIAHEKGKKVFISVGGWNLGDGGGVDARFHRIAATENGRKEFVKAITKFVEEYHLDGVDMDWEYPDADESADHFVRLMQSLAAELHSNGKELTVAVVSYDGRLGSNGLVSSASAIKNEIFNIVDWVNIMAYDDENGKPYPNPHSSFALAEKCLNYWIDERRLPAEKAVLGLPYYGKPGYIGYKKLLESGANPEEDAFDSVFYNGIETIRAKTRLAIKRNCSGVMIWEIGLDEKGSLSLTKAIHDSLY